MGLQEPESLETDIADLLISQAIEGFSVDVDNELAQGRSDRLRARRVKIEA